jgi:hypothetical protein
VRRQHGPPPCQAGLTGRFLFQGREPVLVARVSGQAGEFRPGDGAELPGPDVQAPGRQPHRVIEMALCLCEPAAGHGQRAAGAGQVPVSDRLAELERYAGQVVEIRLGGVDGAELAAGLDPP